MLFPEITLNCGGRLLSLENPLVMGILNLTPDSFYDGGKFKRESDILHQVEKMLLEGATIIDVGGMSSRPGAKLTDPAEELNRIRKPIQLILKKFPDTVLSVDTIHSKVAREMVLEGASIINDISAGKYDPKMYQTIAELGVPYILMHMKGNPEDMQHQPTYEEVTLEILDFFIRQVGKLRAVGVKDIILDPGFGFGKSLDQNYHLLNNLHTFKILDCPLMTGLSRKSMIYKYLGTGPAEALNGTTALHMIALQQGAGILRVHDVKPAMETIKLFLKLKNI